MKDQIIQALHKIKEHFGTEVFNNPRQFKAVLSDVPFETDAKKIRKLLEVAICDMRVYSRLEAGLAKNNLFVVGNLSNEMATDNFMDIGVAQMTIEAIAEELFSYKPVSPAQANNNPPTQQQQSQQQSQYQQSAQQPAPENQPLDMEALGGQLLAKLMGRITSANIPIPQSLPQVKMPNLFNSNDSQIIAPKIGSIIKFGSYDWRVLDVQNDKALIITEEIIENKAYHSDLVDITWADCDLRKYLNGEFINNAKKFSPNDRDRITPVVNRNADNQWYNTNSGSDTTDSIFLLSLEEVREYFGGSMKKLRNVRVPDGWFSDKNDSKRVAKYGKQASWWWLRSPGIYSTSAAIVNIVGSVYVNGNYVHNVHGGIRPALWLNL